MKKYNSSDGRLEERYTSKQLVKLLTNRYGLNPLGIKKLLRVNTNTYRKLLSNEIELGVHQKALIVTIFKELEGRI